MTTERPSIRDKDRPDLGAFTWQDPFRMDDQLTEEERMVQETARAFADEKLRPRVREAYNDETTDPAYSKKWAIWVCWAQPSRKNMAAWTWAMWPMADRPRS